MRAGLGGAGALGLTIAVVVSSLVMRGPFVAVAPVSGVMGSELAMTAAQVGLLTSLPVLCFALFTPAASALIARAGANLAMTLMLLGVAVGVVVRSAGGPVALFVGTVLLGAFITIGNVVVPVLIRRDVPSRRSGIVTGIYISAVNVGSLLGTVATAPLVGASDWRLALASWALPAVAALIVWILVIGPRWAFRWGQVEPRAETGALEALPLEEAFTPPAAPGGRTWSSLTALLLMAGFAGQAFSYYGVTAWLPAILSERLGFDELGAGGAAGVFQICAIAGALGVPLLAARTSTRTAAVVVGVLWLAIPLGLLLAPSGWMLWTVLGGSAQGGGITVVLMAIVQLARGDVHARRLSAFVQGGGYVFGALAATLVGGIYDLSGGWTAPLLVILGAVLVYGVCVALGAGRAGRVRR